MTKSSKSHRPSKKAIVKDRDGDLDVQVDTTSWSDEKKWHQRLEYLIHVDPLKTMTTTSGLELRYCLRFPKLPQTPIIKAIRRYLENGNLCLAQQPCMTCVEINSIRPAGDPTFCCTIEAELNKTKVRSDGSQICAYCSANGQTSCHAWGAYTLALKASVEKKEDSIACESSHDSLFRHGPDESDETSVDIAH